MKAHAASNREYQKNTTTPTTSASAAAATSSSSSTVLDENNNNNNNNNNIAANLMNVTPSLAPPSKLRQLEAKKSSDAFSRNTFLLNNETENRSLLCKWQEISSKRGKFSEYRKQLPVYAYREKVIDSVRNNPVTIICAATGAGKSTQVSQYLLEDYIERNKGSQCNIACTQPRRIAATSVALRIAEEREEKIGDLVGYSIRLESKHHPKKTRLLMCTTGILLRRMQSDPYVGNISHICVDEVHERSTDIDFLLILLRDLLKKRPNDLKVILMSATIEATKISHYFNDAPIIDIPGRTFPVSVISLEVALVATGYRMEEDSPFAIRNNNNSSNKNDNNKRRNNSRQPQQQQQRFSSTSTSTTSKYYDAAGGAFSDDINDGLYDSIMDAEEEKKLQATTVEVSSAINSFVEIGGIVNATTTASTSTSSSSSGGGGINNNNNNNNKNSKQTANNNKKTKETKESNNNNKNEDEQVGIALPFFKTNDRTLLEGAARTLMRMDTERINYELVEEIVLYIDRNFPIVTSSSSSSSNTNNNNTNTHGGAILIFLPGMAEILQCYEQLQSNREISNKSLIFNLHSTLGSSAQQAVFSRPPRGKRKIVLGTNIMETSVTIDDTSYVIDCGKFKENRYDARRALSQLVTCNISKANFRQRRGRCGRTAPGLCFRIYSNKVYDSFSDHQLCEMHRVPLENIVLQIHALNLGDEVSVLSRALDPPARRAIEASVKVLNQLGALAITDKKNENENENNKHQGEISCDDSNNAVMETSTHLLTSLGYHLTNLPVDVRVGKMIILGAILRCVDPVLTIAAALSAKSIFSSNPEDQSRVEGIKRAFTKNHQSDFASSWYAYQSWIQNKKKGMEKKFCRDNFLSVNALMGIQQTKKQLERYLVESGFISSSSNNNNDDDNSNVQEESAASASTSASTTKNNNNTTNAYISLDGTIYEIGGKLYNENSKSLKTITAALAGGLHPNIARITPKNTSNPSSSSSSSLVPVATQDGILGSIHPSSVNAKSMGEFNFPFVAFLEKIKTSCVFIRDTCVVSPYTLILFAGQTRYLQQFEELTYENWLSFHCCAADAALLISLRKQLDNALAAKINDPSSQWESRASVVVKAMIKLIHEESSISLQLTSQRKRMNNNNNASNNFDKNLLQPSTNSSSSSSGGGGGDKTAKFIQGIITSEKRLSYGAQIRLLSKTCFICSEKGHISRDCPNKARKYPGGPVASCFICGSLRHFEIDCPLTKKRELPDGLSATFGND